MSEQVTMTAKEREEWEAYKADKEKKEAAERRKAARVTYQQLVDEELAQAVPELMTISTFLNGVFTASLDLTGRMFA